MGVWNSSSKKNYGFSVAEAMITLLIISVAMAAMAPIFSKKTSSTSNACRWLYTRNGDDITRVTGKVGIGVGISSNPSAKLDIRSGNNEVVLNIESNNTDENIINIKKNGTTIAFVTADGTINTDAANLKNLSIKTSDGNAGIYVENSHPGADIRLRNPSSNDEILLKAGAQWPIHYRRSGTSIAYMDKEGRWFPDQGIPTGAVMFFNLNACPLGWTPVNSDWNNRFIRIANNTRFVGSLQDDALQNHGHVFNAQNSNGSMGTTAFATGGTNNSVVGNVINARIDAETRPVNVALLACEKS